MSEIRHVDPASLKVDAELKNWLDGVPDTVSADLERSLIESQGPVDPLTVWKGQDIVVDGHRRHGLCLKHGFKPIPIREIEFADRQAVKDWMDAWQGSRRNLTPQQYALLLARRIDALRRQKGLGPGKGALGEGGIATTVAEEFGVNKRTVYRAAEWAAALESLPDDLKAKLKSGELTASKTDVVALAGFDELHMRSVFALVESGEYPTLHKALCGSEEEEGDDYDFESEGEDSDIQIDENGDEFDDDFDDDDDIDYEGLDSNGPDGHGDLDTPDCDTVSHAKQPNDDFLSPVEPEPGSWEEQEPQPGPSSSQQAEDDELVPLKPLKREPKPLSKPLAELLDEAMKALGALARRVDALKPADASKHKTIMDLLHDVNYELKVWGKQEAA